MYNRQCRNCSNYWHKDWSVNYECRYGHDTPDFGETEACSGFEESGADSCEDCEHYDQWRFGSSCGKGYEIPDSKDACEDFEVKSESHKSSREPSEHDDSGPNESESAGASPYAEDSGGGDDTNDDDSDAFDSSGVYHYNPSDLGQQSEGTSAAVNSSISYSGASDIGSHSGRPSQTQVKGSGLGLVVGVLILAAIGIGFTISVFQGRRDNDRPVQSQQSQTEQRSEAVPKDISEQAIPGNTARSDLERRLSDAVVKFENTAIRLKPLSRSWREQSTNGPFAELIIKLIDIRNSELTVEICNTGSEPYSSKDRSTYALTMYHPTREYSWVFNIPDSTPGECQTVTSKSSPSIGSDFFNGQVHACNMSFRQTPLNFGGEFKAQYAYEEVH